MSNEMSIKLKCVITKHGSELDTINYMLDYEN